MAAIIDGTTYAGFWKLTPDDGSPTSFSLFPKDSIYAKSASGTSTIHLISDPTGATTIIDIANGIEDENGNDLVDFEGLCNYLSDKR